jgi:transcriptional regulator NrdR family protein
LKKRKDTLKFECPYCHSINRTSVVDLSYKKGNGTVVRRRECLICSQRFNTVEHVIIGYSNKENEIRKAFVDIAKTFSETEAKLRLFKRTVLS